ncbi:hypothetical protein CLAIMM_15041 isoform 2 [Cladophialophora immunda]|nr:hypothetical protein CLAIMM_15041 isoform 1 [Cladophialophora immunda]OQV11161.1 hypothetical protein CLAIMM_15041 isoform 2 [Cladophialophora immunda]
METFIRQVDWVPYYHDRSNPHLPPQPVFSFVEQQLQEIRDSLDPENRAQLYRRRARRQEVVDQEMLESGARQLERQAVLIAPPDAVPKRQWAKAKTHGLADARGPTANELARRPTAKTGLSGGE